jgi:uncharacterized protein involved in exopolysaccharide biosynthesis
MDEQKNEMMVEEEEINLLELLQVVVRRKRMIAKVCGGAAVLSIVISLFLPNIYSATARVLPPQKETGGGLAALLGQAGGLAGLAAGMGLGGSGDLYLGILKSRSVADAVIKRYDLAKEFKTRTPDDTRKALEGIVKMQAAKDGIITVTVDDKDPQRAAALANAFVEELGRKSVQLNLTKAGTERAFLEKRLEMVKDDLKRAENDLRSFEEKNKTIKIDSQAAASIQGIARLKAEIISREVQLASLRSYQTDESPEVKLLQAAVGKLRTQLGRLAGSGSGGEGIPNIGNVPNLGIEYARKMREVKIQEAIFEQLTKQYEVAKLTEAKDSSSIQVLDDAVVPMRKSKPKRALIVILSTVTAFFIAVFAAFIQEYFGKMPDEDRARWEEIRAMMLQWRTSR